MARRAKGKRRPKPLWQEATHLRFHADKGSTLWQLRDEAHRAFDVHWQFYDNSKQRRLARARAYRWLARKLGVPESECHFGMFGVPRVRVPLRHVRRATVPPRHPGLPVGGPASLRTVASPRRTADCSSRTCSGSRSGCWSPAPWSTSRPGTSLGTPSSGSTASSTRRRSWPWPRRRTCTRPSSPSACGGAGRGLSSAWRTLGCFRLRSRILMSWSYQVAASTLRTAGPSFKKDGTTSKLPTVSSSGT